MKKSILGVIIATIFMIAPISSYAFSETSYPDVTKNVSKETINRIDKKIKSVAKELTKAEKTLDSYTEKHKSQGTKFTSEQRVKVLESVVSNLEQQDSETEDIYFISEYLPTRLVKANIDNDIKSQQITQKLLAAILQTMSNDIKADLEFKVAGDRNQTLMVIGKEPVNMTMDEFSEDLKLSMIYLGFEDILFTDLNKDVRLEKIKARVKP